MSTKQEIIVGAIVTLSQGKDGNYDVGQVGEDLLKAPGRDVGDRKPISWDLGPHSGTGWVDTETLDIGVTVSIWGISIGTFYGNMGNLGLKVNVNLTGATGWVMFYSKNRTTAWVRISLDLKAFGDYMDDFQTLEW
ncbi:hypothetical protein BDV23DRAFT_178453 [Aspergillus alliaceus]|uniref:Uncharacterized protein n=1 Tax=Petromyces alliaceus TaxID=209559 RepID=A0A5N7CQC4_PETAA|nr:hypothetical protein BDV23DRAFT_178453 [Aspergillus alliaceus]